MTQTFSRTLLSNDPTGSGIAIGTSLTHLHTAGSDLGVGGEVWLYAVNTHTSGQQLEIRWAQSGAGGSGTGGSTITQTLPRKSGLTLVVPGLILAGNAIPLSINANVVGSGATADVVVIYGYVNKIESTTGFVY